MYYNYYLKENQNNIFSFVIFLAGFFCKEVFFWGVGGKPIIPFYTDPHRLSGVFDAVFYMVVIITVKEV